MPIKPDAAFGQAFLVEHGGTSVGNQRWDYEESRAINAFCFGGTEPEYEVSETYPPASSIPAEHDPVRAGLRLLLGPQQFGQQEALSRLIEHEVSHRFATVAAAVYAAVEHRIEQQVEQRIAAAVSAALATREPASERQAAAELAGTLAQVRAQAEAVELMPLAEAVQLIDLSYLADDE